MQDYDCYVGIDWAAEAHQVCVLDRLGKVLQEFVVRHSGEGLEELLEQLSERCAGQPSRVAVAIETPRGPVVEALLERLFEVYAVNPKQLDRFRDRHSVAGAKDDRLDALVLADALRTDQRLMRRVRPDDPLVVQIRELSRMEEELGVEFGALSNRLREQLQRFYVQPLTLCPAANEPWLWSLLELAPSPAEAARLRPKQLEALLKKHRIRRFSAPELAALLRSPALKVAAGTTEAACAHIALLLPKLRLVQQQRADCAKRLEQLLERFDQQPGTPGPGPVQILLSLPGVGLSVASTLLSEAAQSLAEADYQALRTHSGVAPVTKRSGKAWLAHMRYACSKRLRNALYHWARVSMQNDPRCAQHYQALRQRGHSHGRALRGVADRLLKLLAAMLKSRSLFNPQQWNHAALPSKAQVLSGAGLPVPLKA
jgi:transposase